MTVKELKRIVQGLPDDLPVCGVGHYGEQLKIWDVAPQEVYINSYNASKKISALVVSMEDRGEEPD